MRHILLGKILLLAGLLLLASGCGASGSKKAVSGKVTFDGKPLEAGMIVFTPTDPNVKAVGGAPIVNGTYSIPGGEKGLEVGKYKVEITSSDTSKVKVEDAPGTGGQEGPGPERI